MYDLLLKNVGKHITLTTEEEELFTSFLQIKKLKRKQFFVQEGDINKYQAFVTEGCLRSYSIDENGFEHILQFAPPDWWIGDIYSIVKQQPGKLNIDAIFDSELIVILRTDMLKLFTAVPKFERYFRILAENSLMGYQARLMDNLGLTARDRYNNFCRSYPSLIQTLPQKQVAAYIGVTPEFLSKMLNSSMVRQTG